MDDLRVQWLCARAARALGLGAGDDGVPANADEVAFALDSAGVQRLLFSAQQYTEEIVVPATPPPARTTLTDY